MPGSDPARRPDTERREQEIVFLKRLIELESEFSALLKGQAGSVGNDERRDMAFLCFWKKQFATSARLFSDVLVASSTPAGDALARDHAARAAALAGCGRGEDAAGLSESQRRGGGSNRWMGCKPVSMRTPGRPAATTR